MLKKIGVLLTLMVLVACGKTEETKEPKKIKKEIKAKTVRVMEMSLTNVVRNNITSGIIDPINEVDHITETGGDIVKINYNNGQRVNKGDVILVLEDQDIKATYEKSEAEYISAKSDYKTKEVNYKKYKKLYTEELIAEDEFLDMENQYIQSQSTMKMRKAEYETAKKDYSDLTMKSKLSGVVADLDVKLYEKISMDSEVFSVIDDSKMRIKTGVYGKEINTLELGSKVIVTPETMAGIEESYEGKVYEINPVADEVTKKYEVKVEISNDESKLKKGMYSDVLIETGSRTGFVVPKSAIVIKDLYQYVFILDGNTARQIKVTSGYTQGENQEVISEELPKEFKLVIDGQFLLENNDLIKVIS